MTEHTLQQEFEYYTAHRDELVSMYLGQYVIIKNEAVVGAFVEEDDALNSMLSSGHELGTFLIHLVKEDNDDEIQMFHSRVAFV